MTPGSELESSEAEIPTVKSEPLQWDVEMEVQLFYAMAPHKPVGINKHFHMTAIWEKMSNSIAREITSGDIWKHLETLYDIPMLDDTEPIPFSTEETDFSLPEDEYGEYVKRKVAENAAVDYNEDVPSPPQKSSTPKSTPRSTSKDSKPRKESLSGTKTRKESGSSHASTDTPTNKSDKDFGPRLDRRNSRDSNTSGTRDSSSGRKSTSHKKTPKSRTGRPSAADAWSEENEPSGRSRRRTNTSTPPPVAAKRRRT